MKHESVKLNWRGPQLGGQSLAIVNRNICKYLQQNRNIDLRKELPESDRKLHLTLKDSKNTLSPFSTPDITITHQWPPNWSNLKTGIRVFMQPWEYGAIPREWYIPMKYWADEIWVYSSYNKESYIRSGIPENKVKIIPLGVDGEIYHTNVEPFKLDSTSFKFLFVGGTIGRKGIDILLQAYLNEFTADDDVCLCIKDTGKDSFYKGITLEKMILEAMMDPKNPRIVYMDDHLSEAELAGLYKACDCLVHPYRGEGFGLPIAEAMACGIPVIVPDKGSCRDFCTEETAFFISSKEVFLKEKKVGNLETVDLPWWLSIEPEELQKVMRHVYENRTLVREKGQKASQYILSSFTWEKTAQHVLDRVKYLVEKPSIQYSPNEDIILLEIELANRMYSENRAEAALETYLNILAVYPADLMARYNAVVVYIGMENYMKAIEHLFFIAQHMEQQSSDFQEKVWQLIKYCSSQTK